MNNKSAYIWGIVSRFGPQVIYLLTTMVLARFVSAKEFGMIGVLAVIFTVANILIDSGLGGSLIKEKYISKVDCSTITIFNAIVGILIYFLLFHTSTYIESYFNVIGLANVVKVIGVVFPITALGVVPVSLLKRKLEFKKICISSISSVVIASIISIYLAINEAGVYSLVAYQIMVNAVTVLLNYIFSRYFPCFSFSYDSLKRLLPFGFYTSIVTIVDTIYENLLTVLTGKFLNVQSAGYIYQAKRLEEAMSASFATSVGIVAFPVLTQFKNDVNRFVTEGFKTFNVITLLIFPILVTVSIYSEQVIFLLFGSSWLESAPYLSILMFAGLFIIMENLFLSFIKAWGQVRDLMYWTIIKRIIGISVLLFSLSLDSDYLVHTYLLTTIIGFCINAFLFCRLVKISISNIFRIVILNLFPVLMLYFICKIIMISESGLPISLVVTILLLVFYYCFYLRFKGIDLLDLLFRIIKKKI